MLALEQTDAKIPTFFPTPAAEHHALWVWMGGHARPREAQTEMNFCVACL